MAPGDSARMTPSHLTPQAKGRQAEELAAAYLTSLGYRILERNYRCRQGEIDLIAIEAQTVVFVEVRRRTGSAALAAESIDPHKMQRVAAAAAHYLHARKLSAPCRFDAVLVTGADAPAHVACQHIKEAFTMADTARTRRDHRYYRY